MSKKSRSTIYFSLLAYFYYQILIYVFIKMSPCIGAACKENSFRPKSPFFLCWHCHKNSDVKARLFCNTAHLFSINIEQPAKQVLINLVIYNPNQKQAINSLQASGHASTTLLYLNKKKVDEKSKLFFVTIQQKTDSLFCWFRL